jgi:tRNA pseudouridine55 synthase
MTDGFLNVNKPAGWTSFDVVGFVRRRSRVRRVGHAGTLDPMATGVLPVMLGRATRLADYLADTTKTYVATVELGLETNTYDSEGEVVRRLDASDVSIESVTAGLERFRGEFIQVAPAFSAIKRGGVPLYKLARRGDAVSPPARAVRVDRLDIMFYQPPLVHLEIECSKGFYVRSLAHDIGVALGVGGTLTGLVRTRVGPFRLEDSVDIDTLERELDSGAWPERLVQPDEVLLAWRAAILGDDDELRLRHGRPAVFQPAEPIAAGSPERFRAYTVAGDFLAVLRRTAASEWRSERLFAPE